VKGELQGHVLVASVRLCQMGPDCGEGDSVPVLLVINPYERVLSGLVRLPNGCTSPALKDSYQVLLKSTAPQPQDDSRDGDGDGEPEEAAAPVAPAAPAPAPAQDPAGSIAQARKDAPPTVEEGQRLLQSGNHMAAQALFEQVLAADARNVAAVVGLAASQLGLGDVDAALKTLERVRNTNRPDVYLWTAYAHLKDRNRVRARESLRKAMEVGWAPGNRPAEAVPETALRDDIEALMQQRNRKRTPGRESPGSGNPSP
jgi:tetratricopeptide (TPR) repeat protein